MRTTPNNITELKPNEIFIFGSNKYGHHISGAAKIALDKFGAIEGQGIGLQGQSFAINTMSGIEEIKYGIELLLFTANQFPEFTYLVTEIGCGIAGHKPEQIAPLFKQAKEINNIHLPESFWAILNQQ